MGFAATVFLIGILVLLYQQNRFRPPAFPAAGAIDPQLESKATDDPDLDLMGEEGNNAEASSDAPGITLRVLGTSDAGGSVRVAVYHSADNFNDVERANWKTAVPLTGDAVAECTIPLQGLPATFAIAAYQDTNDNEKLDRGLLGIPSERYGFSNAARGKVGPPSFEQATIETPAARKTIELKIW